MSDQALVDAAKAPILAYNEKNWDALNRAIASDLAYDEVATHRNLRGAADVIDAWKGWAAAFPDSKATFEGAHVSGSTVILEVTWRGTQSGPLRTPGGDIPATGKTIESELVRLSILRTGKLEASDSTSTWPR